MLTGIGVRAGWRRQRAAAAILGVWALTVIVSAILLPLWGNPRYFAAAIVPLAGFVALGALAVWDRVLATWQRRPLLARMAACSIVLVAVLPAARFDASVLVDPAHASYPGLDEPQYVTRPSALAPLGAIAREIEQRAGPIPS